MKLTTKEAIEYARLTDKLNKPEPKAKPTKPAPKKTAVKSASTGAKKAAKAKKP